MRFKGLNIYNKPLTKNQMTVTLGNFANDSEHVTCKVSITPSY
jgi:hypothetical protein